VVEIMGSEPRDVHEDATGELWMWNRVVVTLASNQSKSFAECPPSATIKPRTNTLKSGSPADRSGLTKRAFTWKPHHPLQHKLVTRR
jgi:hypothetical protein